MRFNDRARDLTRLFSINGKTQIDLDVGAARAARLTDSPNAVSSDLSSLKVSQLIERGGRTPYDRLKAAARPFRPFHPSLSVSRSRSFLILASPALSPPVSRLSLVTSAYPRSRACEFTCTPTEANETLRSLRQTAGIKNLSETVGFARRSHPSQRKRQIEKERKRERERTGSRIFLSGVKRDSWNSVAALSGCTRVPESAREFRGR